MLETVVLFILCNFILLTVQITVSRLLILVLITIIVMHAYKRFKQTLSIDRIAIQPFANVKYEGQQIFFVELLAHLLTLIIHKQSL
jgi:hypothetical protein